MLYSAGLHGPFVLDDRSNLPQATIESLTFDSLSAAATSNTSGMLGRPISALSFALSHLAADGQSTFPFKVANLAIHLVNASLVYVVCTLLLKAVSGYSGAAGATEQRIALAALITAITWGLHPLQVSTVLYVVQRMTQLMTMFSLLSLACYFMARASASESPRCMTGYATGALAFAGLSVLSKENGVLIPVYIILLEAVIRATRRPMNARVRRFRNAALRICMLLSLISVATLALKWPDFHEQYKGLDFTPVGRISAQANILVLYAAQILVPSANRLVFYYDWLRAPAEFGLKESFSVALLAGALLTAYVARNRYPVVSLGIVWFFAAHLLESSPLPLELAFEHRNYLALLGPSLLFGWIVALALTRPERPHVWVGAATFSVVLSWNAAILHERVGLWHDAISLNAHATSIVPQSERAIVELSIALTENGHPDSALRLLDLPAASLGDSALLPLQALQILWFLDRPGVATLERTRRALAAGPVRTAEANLLNLLFEQRLVSENDHPTIDQLAGLYDAAMESVTVRLDARHEGMLQSQYHRLLKAQGRTPESMFAIEHAYRLIPRNGETALRYAEAMTNAGESRGVHAALLTATQLAPQGSASISERIHAVKTALEKLHESAPGM